MSVTDTENSNEKMVNVFLYPKLKRERILELILSTLFSPSNIQFIETVSSMKNYKSVDYGHGSKDFINATYDSDITDC